MELDPSDSNSRVVDASQFSKYRDAGALVSKAFHQVASRCVPGASTREISSYGDNLLDEYKSSIYKSQRFEKGIAEPTSICVNNCAYNYAPGPESIIAGNDNSYHLQVGDVTKISMGLHFDGYTALISHTIVVTPPPQPGMGPYIGPGADAICAAHYASKAVANLLATNNSDDPITGSRLRKIVDDIASQFRVSVCPGSRIRRISRFLVGQPTIDRLEEDQNTKHAVEWPAPEEETRKADVTDSLDPANVLSTELNTWHVMPKEAWLIDISMSSQPISSLKEHPDLKPTLYIHDVNVSYMLKLKASRSLLSEIKKEKSVFPFHFGSLSSERNLLGLRELTDRHILVPMPVLISSPSNVIAREELTVITQPNPSSDLLCLTVPTPPSYVKSDFSLEDGTDAALICEGINVNIKSININV
ncbi:putative metalloprotease arx1 [Schizosaccharomyces pombe]